MEVRGRGEKGVTKGSKKTFGGNRSVHYLDCSDFFTCIHISQPTKALAFLG